jgi:hypothetical protein
VSSLAKRLASHHAAGLDSAPAERWQHAQELAAPTMTRGPHRVGSVVETLYDARLIGDPERDAAVRFRRDHELALLSAHEDAGRGSGGTDALHVLMLARCRALDAHHGLTEALGPTLTQLAIDAIVHDMTYRAIDRASGRDGEHHKETAGAVAALLHALPGLYRQIDRWHGRAPARRAA